MLTGCLPIHVIKDGIEGIYWGFRKFNRGYECFGLSQLVRAPTELRWIWTLELA